MKILVAYDGTLSAREALHYGIHRAGMTGGKLFVLNVFNHHLFIDYEGIGAEEKARSVSEGHIAEAKKILAESAKGIESKVYSVDGLPEEEILRFAREERVDLILASRQYHGVLRSAPCSATVVPHRGEALEKAL